jgi:hypothetical protein
LERKPRMCRGSSDNKEERPQIRSFSRCQQPLEVTKRYEPLVGARLRADERTVRIKDSARERHGLFRCGAFGAACVAVHRSDIREWHPPQARIVIQHSGRLFGSAFCKPDPQVA